MNSNCVYSRLTAFNLVKICLQLIAAVWYNLTICVTIKTEDFIIYKIGFFMDRKITVQKYIIVIKYILLFCLAATIIKALFISLDIDESYAVAQAYRMAIGDKLVLDMWEPHQFSAFLSALFIKPYLLLFKTTTYLVIYLRLIGCGIHLALGIWLERISRREFGKNMGAFLAMLHVFFLPKWVQSPEFELMHYWFFLAIFLCLFTYFKNGNRHLRWLIIAGICFAGAVLCYPTMVLLYPVYLLGIWKLTDFYYSQGVKIKWYGIGAFTCGGLLAGLGLLVYLISYMTPSEMLHNLSYIFMDESHMSVPTVQKWNLYWIEIGNMAKDISMYGICVLIAASIVLFIIYISGGNRRANLLRRMKEWKRYGAILLIIYVIAVILLLQGEQILGCLFKDKNQFYFLLRFPVITILGIILWRVAGKNTGIYFWTCLLPGILSVPAVLIISNMTVNVALSKMYIAVLGSFLILAVYVQQKGTEAPWIKTILTACQYILCMAVLTGFLVCRLILIRITGCGPVTINATLEQVSQGPAKGIYILARTAEVFNRNYDAITAYVDEEDCLLYVGGENLVYLLTGAQLATPSTQGSTAFNEIFLEYYKNHPDRLPTVVAMDKTFAVEPEYYYSPSNYIILEWIEENYREAEKIETEYLTIYKNP